MALSDIYQKAKLVLIPSGYKASTAKLYSVVPNNGSGDFTVSADADATRVNKNGLIEAVAANQARLNYDPSNPQDPTLLLEPTRTQLAGYPTAITSANGYALANGTLTANDSTAPDGSLTASTFKATSANGELQKVKTGSSGVEYTVSVYVKRKTGTGTVYLRAVENANTAVAVTNEWTRVSATVTSTSTDVRFGMALATSGDEIYVWGFQVEVGSYPTSFIPNADNSEITRTADSCKLENFANAPTDYPFTVFWEGRVDDISTNQNPFSILDASSSVKYLSFSFANTGFFQVLRRNVDYDIDSETFSISVGDVLKIAIAFTSNTTYKCYINGSLERNETSGLDVDFDFNDILIGQLRVVPDTGTRNQASQFMIFNEALTDSELQTLTS